MPARRTVVRWFGLFSALLLCLVGVGIYTAVVAARTFLANFGTMLMVQAFQELGRYLNLMLALETVRAFVVLATQGPVVAAVWVASRVGFWMGQLSIGAVETGSPR